jgi:hypothetical protein
MQLNAIELLTPSHHPFGAALADIHNEGPYKNTLHYRFVIMRSESEDY